MHKQEDHAEEVRRLRRTMRDLVALSTLPAIWTGMASDGIARSLADVLLNTLSLDLVYVRLAGLTGEGVVEVVRSKHQPTTNVEAMRAAVAPLLASDRAEPPSTIPDPSGAGTLHVTVTRFGVGGDHGVLVTGSSNPDFPTERDRLLLGVGANQTAIVVQQSRAEQRVREQAERLRTTLASIGDGVITTDTEGRITNLNAVAESLTGWKNTDAVGQPLDAVFRIVNETTRQPAENPARRALEAGVIVGLANHTVLIGKDGTERPIDDSAAPIRCQEGEIVGCVLVFRDVTERRKADAALRESELRYRLVGQAAKDAIWDWDLVTNRVAWNEGVRNVFGYTEEQVGPEASWWLDHIHPDDRDRITHSIHGVINGRGELWQDEYRYRRADGSYAHVFDRGRVVRDVGGRPVRMVGSMLDLTERNRAEAALRERDELLRLAERAAEAGVWDFNTATGEAHWSENCHRLYGTDPATFTPSLDTWVALVHPDDRAAATEKVRQAIERREEFNFEFRIEHPAKGERWLWEVGKAEYDDRGQPLRMAGITMDITARKRAEAKVREQEQRTRTILESITDAFCALDRDWRFTYVNRRAEVLLGRSRDDLIGKNHWEEYPTTLGTDLECSYRRAVTENVTVALEHFHPAHDRWYEVHAYPSPDGLSVYFRDVSERKRAEAALRESEEKLRLLADTIPQLAWMAKPDGHIFWYNRRWYEYTGTTPEEMEGWGWQSVHDPEILPKVLDRWKGSIASGEPFDMVFPLRGEDKQFRPFLTRVNPLRDERGRVLYWFGTNTDISDMKAMEEALLESAQRFRELADAMPQIVWTARPDGSIDYLNRRWSEFTGLPQTVTNDAWGSLLHPDDAPAAYERWAACVQSGAPFEMELRLLDRRQQTYRWHLIRTMAVPNGDGGVARWFGTSTDIHEQKRTEEHSRFLAEASAALAAVVDYESTLQKVANLAVPYFADWSAVDLADDDGNLRRLAVAHQEADKVALVRELMREYPPDPQSPTGGYAVLRTGKPQILSEIPDEMLVQAAQDERHLALIRSLGLKSYICVPLVISGKTLGLLTFATAESSRKFTEADLALAIDLAHRAAIAIENTQLYQALREADRRKDEFLATLAHELRNPLAPVRNALEILKMPRVDSQTAERSREIMERQVQHLVRLVDDLLDMSRVMRGKIELRREKVELATIVASAVETVQPLVDAQGHRLNVRISAESLLLDGDPVRLAQVAGNLLTNAAKYTEPNGQIWLTGEREGGMVVLRVRDNGIGIEKGMLPRIFELFEQADHASTKAQGGLGIGLTLVTNLVELHNGTVEAHSEGLGHGSEFVVRLPLVEQTVEQDHGSDTAGQAYQVPPPSGKRLLVVDDNHDAANSVAMLLKLQRHEVRVAYSGLAALEMIKTYTPDVVLLDLGMAGMDGYEVARRIRQTPGLGNVVLAALTGWGQQEDCRRTAEAGFDHHLVKPADPEALEKLLAK